jgi:hypothetical protein
MRRVLRSSGFGGHKKPSLGRVGPRSPPQPTLHDFLQEAVLDQAFALNSTQVVGPEHTFGCLPGAP